MRVFVAVNDVRDIGPRQTTALLVAAAIRAGHETFLFDINGFSVASRDTGVRVTAQCVGVDSTARSAQCVCDVATSDRQIRSVTVTDRDLILIRTNPGRDKMRIAVHTGFLNLCRLARSAGISVVNDPRWMEFFASKASLADIDPMYCPDMLVSTDVRAIVDFVQTAPGDCVLKPTVGSRGENVIRVNRESCDRESIERLTGDGSLIVQHFVAHSPPGDKRVVVVCGEILQIDGNYGGIERHPADGDFRANLHAGGTSHPLNLNHAELQTASYAAQLLNDHGIRLAGVDLIGSQIIEFNVFSTGGLFDAERFSNCDFSALIIRRLTELH